jgi:GTPase SAR1 family protein
MSKVTKYKIVFAGDQNVGKTSVISRFMFDSHNDAMAVRLR